MLGASATTVIVMGLVFCSAALLTLAAVGALARRERVRERFELVGPASVVSARTPRRGPRLDPALLGFDAAAQRKLRGELVRAGFFDPGAVALFVTARAALLVAAPLLGFVFVRTVVPDWEALPKLGVAVLFFVVALYGPAGFLSRRQRKLQDKYRIAFPDYVDMLVVCINAGLSLEAALERAARELGPDNAELKGNLDLMAGEMRAGQGTTDALRSCAERLGLREARSLSALLTQSIELGTDVATALTVFSDEMRDRRMARAEERAAALPPKLTLPLGLFIFPVVLIVVMTPAVFKLLGALGR